jgi:prephenate dehydrogenase
VGGTGLLGTSIGLALGQHDVEVTLEDMSTAALAMAVQLGAGRARFRDDPPPRLVVVATPPDVTAAVVMAQLERFDRAVVTDVASVKGLVADALAAGGADLSRYVGSHPMAGKERSGPAAASADLFTGRPWVIAAPAQAAAGSVLAVRELATDLQATPLYMDSASHDAAVALVSHVPQVMATLTAARLATADPAALDLAGQGLRDVTRIARSDPRLWASILAGNGPAVAGVLKAIREDLDRVIGVLDGPGLGHALVELSRAMALGNQGAERIPGKHGGARVPLDAVTVLVPDQPGELGRLFGEFGALGVNLEDLRLEHAAGRAMGMATASVGAGLGAGLKRDLEARGWKTLA